MTRPDWNTYGMGWFQQDYKGHKLDFHTGSLFGLVAIAGVMHDKNMAVYVFANLDHAELRHAILYKAIDLYAFNDDSRDWNTEVFKLYEGFKKESLEQSKKKIAERVKNTKTSLPVSAYAGTYVNEMLGTAKVVIKENGPMINFNDFITYDMEHWHYDTFMTNKDKRFREKLEVRFQLDTSGKVNDLYLMGEIFTKTD
ncbi:DUF3471 domain-containing protein [Maribacter halichondriae]|uniref:DUF3471 domain-containing protein n=1 Tax=Maribacter halichondriae TaxID=2980554 RepID=UPI0023594177|nr:DUF3471 domain-containing protein [Maribacter sp. Hal144]